jgi:peptidyl-tRNA hydrolase
MVDQAVAVQVLQRKMVVQVHKDQMVARAQIPVAVMHLVAVAVVLVLSAQVDLQLEQFKVVMVAQELAQ